MNLTILDLRDQIDELNSIINNLKENVTRKYAQCSNLKMKNTTLRKRVAELQQYAPVDIFKLEVLNSQSGESDASGPLQTEHPVTETANQQITAFHEETGGWAMSIDSAEDATMNLGVNSDAQLGAFLSRPIRIATIEWAVGDALLAEFNPWEQLHDNRYFQSKIDNFELLRHKLRMRFVVSATPFHYGRALVSYNPYFFDDQVTRNRLRVPADVINSSQKPHIWIDPANNAGGELTLPFFFPRNFVSVSEGDHRFLGKVDIQSTSVLQHANGGNDPVYISVFAWAEDVKLSVPTSLLADTLARSRDVLESQARITDSTMDEYGSGIISKPASAVAKAAGALTRFPSIAPYARASQICASAVGSIATLFGMSRPTVLSNPNYIKPFPQGNLPNVDTHETVTKLALDSKNEVTIDPRVVGLEDKDEMGIVDFVKRESYLTTFTMNSSDGVDARLFEARVTPTLFDINDDGANSTEYHLPPCAYMANAFNYWHGSITYKFQIVKSKFHKGKILIQFDPQYFGGFVNFNTNYSRIIDLASEDEFEITVGWCQSRPWLKVLPLWESDTNWSNDGSLAGGKPDSANGMIRVSVLNKLVSPAEDTPITFNVLVRMEDDAKFAQPTQNHFEQLSFLDSPDPSPVLESQSAETTITDVNKTATAPVGAPTVMSVSSMSPVNDNMTNVFFGESPTTLRELLKRYVRTRVHVLPASDPNDYTQYILREKIAPFHRGYDVESSQLDQDGNGFNYVQNTFMSYFMPCYAGWRGGLRKKFSFPGVANVCSNPTITWDVPAQTQPYQELIGPIQGSREYLRDSLSAAADMPTGGLMTTNLGINDTLEVEFPYYKWERFIPARQLTAFTLDERRLRMDVGISEGLSNQQSIIQEYNAVADDFSLHFFTGTPILHIYATPPSGA